MLIIKKRHLNKLQKLEQYVKIKERRKIENNLRIKIVGRIYNEDKSNGRFSNHLLFVGTILYKL